MLDVKRFKLGQVVMTSTINNTIAEDEQFAKDITIALARYIKADFSDMEHQEDIEANNEAIKIGNDRIFATYNTCKGKIYIITEWDHSYTTIMFPDEY